MMPRDAETWFQRRISELDQDPDSALEWVLIDVTEQIARAMEANGVTRKELAERMGVKPPLVTRLLNGSENTTLRTLMRVAYALDMAIEVRLQRPRRGAHDKREMPPEVRPAEAVEVPVS